MVELYLEITAEALFLLGFMAIFLVISQRILKPFLHLPIGLASRRQTLPVDTGD
jgi:hypothetical protein